MKAKFEIKRLEMRVWITVASRAIFGLDFKAVEIFEAAEFQSGRAEMLEVHKRLLHKSVGNVGVIIVRRVVVSTQARVGLAEPRPRRCWASRESTAVRLR